MHCGNLPRFNVIWCFRSLPAKTFKMEEDSESEEIEITAAEVVEKLEEVT